MSEGLSSILAARREVFNATFRRQGRGVDEAAFSAYLERCVDPVVSALDPAHGPAAAEAMFELGLPAVRRGLVGGAARSPFEEAMIELLPRLGAHFTDHPRPSLAALGNGYLRLERELGPATAMRWLHALVAVGDRCDDARTFHAAGLVLAWRHGLTEAREAAFAHASTMDAPLLEELVGATSLDPDPERRFMPPGDARAVGPVTLVGRVGGFVGFGGPFRTPPEVHAVSGRLYATDGDVVRAIHADVFGARARPTPMTALALLEAQTAAAPVEVSARGHVRWAEQEAQLPELRRPATVAAVPGLAAVTLQRSHGVYLLGRGPA